MEQKMLNNFIKKYGIDGLKRITELFLANESNQVIAQEFGVTRQRVHQWQKVFVVVSIKVNPVVAMVLNAVESKRQK